MMRSAKETAEYVALTQLGYPAEIIPGDVIVLDLVCLEANDDGTECVDYAPSDDVLDPGDKLLAVDGVELDIIDDLGPILEEHQPGDVVEVEFERPGEGTKTGEVELIASNDGTDRTIIGFQPFDTASADLPFDVDIDSGAIGGPSAGLAFTLTLIDELTPGELTGGHEVAVTGTIQIDGSVGAIGGLVSKTSAVKQRGAKVLHRADGPGRGRHRQGPRGGRRRPEIIPVDNLDQALAALAELGGNGLDLGTPGADFQPTRVAARGDGRACHHLGWSETYAFRSMAISFSRPDPSSPSSVASASFPTSRKGFEQADVREFLRMVAAELARLQERERFLERELRTSQRSTSPSSIALDEELVTKMLGEEAARILQTAREAGDADQDPRRGGRVAPAARGHRRGAAAARRGRDRGGPSSPGRHGRRRVRARDGQAAGPRDGQRGARPTASVCSTNWPVVASWPASRSSSSSTGATGCCRRSSGRGWWPST